MNEYRCPVCGGELVWEYERGEVTCSKCGLVVDRIYYYGPPRVNEDEVLAMHNELKKRARRLDKRRYKLYLKRYRMAQRYVKNKPWIEVDYDKVVETGRMVYTMRSHASIIAEKNIKERKLDKPLEKIIETLREKYPIALARTHRSKYALAYIIYTFIEKKKYPSQEETTRIFQISITSYRRLVKLAKKIIPLIQPSIKITEKNLKHHKT